jgi:hypothetical protein
VTGWEHYREAERLLVEAEDVYARPDALVRAQVHATLAAAAAAAPADDKAYAAYHWRQVAHEPRPDELGLAR